MVMNKDTSKKTAELLLQIKAIKLSPSDPFLWASGWKSPIYCDNRVTLSYPPVRVYLKEEIVKITELEYGKPDVIACVANIGNGGGNARWFLDWITILLPIHSFIILIASSLGDSFLNICI